MLVNLAVAPSFGFNKPVRQFGIQHRIHFKPTAKPFERAKSQCPPTASGHAQTGVDNSLKKRLCEHFQSPCRGYCRVIVA